MKKTDYSKFMKALKGADVKSFTKTYTIANDDGEDVQLSVTISPRLGVVEMASLVEAVAAGVCPYNGVYQPALLEPMKLYCLFRATTDLPLEDLVVVDKDGQSHYNADVLDAVVVLDRLTTLCPDIRSAVPNYSLVYDAISDAVAYRKSVSEQSESAFEALGEHLNGLLDRFGAALDKLNESGLLEKLGGLDTATIAAFLGAPQKGQK